MKFELIDKIESLDDTQLTAVKYVSLAEEYLADHFPTFPVLPGVLMLEAATQASAWLLHHKRGFAKSIAVLKEARNVKYGHFVAPGNSLRITVSWKSDTASGGAEFKALGEVCQPDGSSKPAFAGLVEIAYLSLGDKDPSMAEVDQKLLAHTRTRWDLVKPTKIPHNTPLAS